MKCLSCRKTIETRDLYGLHRDCFLKDFKLTDPLKFSNLDPKKPDSSGHTHIKKIKDSFYHGRYRKYSASLGATKYILKIQEKDFPDLPATEYLCNEIASLLGLRVPEYHLIKYKVEDDPENSHREQTPNEKQNNNKTTTASMTFAVRNFMQDYKGGTLHHIYKFLPKGEKNYNCKNIINILFQHTKPVDVARFIEVIFFDSLIGNNDRHGRNLGIIESTGRKRLAPIYDNPSYFGIESNDLIGADFNISGCIQTSLSKEPMLLDYMKEFQSLGFEKIHLKFFKKTVRKSQEIIELVESSGISKKRRKAFIKFLNKQLKIMKDI